MSIFPTKILLATDGSEEAILAARAAADIADKTGSELHVVHVRIPPYHRSYYEGIYIGDYLPQEEAELEREAEDLLKEQVGKIEAAGGSVARTHLRTGRPEAEIIALAEEIGAGLIILGSRGLGGMRRALLGSVSDSVVRHAHCPVLVVRAREGGEEEEVLSSKRILLATDGSKEAELAAHTAADLATKIGSELHVVHVGPSTEYSGTEEPLVTDIFELSQEELEEINNELERLLDAQVKQIEAGGGSVERAYLKTGKPDEQIVALGEEIGAGLIALGSRGLGEIRRALMGSISDSVVRHAHCPVLVVRREEQG